MTDLDEIKQKIDIVSLISEYVTLKKTGSNFKGLCPFHNEKTPSFVVSPERQIWHCFGGCQDGGDIFKFLMRVENLEFFESLQILAKKAGVTLASFQATPQAKLKERALAANQKASEFYHFILTDHPMGKKAREYLKSRKISDDSAKLFSIGYAPNSWDSLTKFLTKKGFSQAEMETAGLVSRSGIGRIFDRFRGRLMFTLCDHRGNPVGFAGRLMDMEAKEAKYINTQETILYVKGAVLYGLDITHEEIKKKKSAVIVEGEIDCIQSYQAGIKNVVAIKGSALTSGHVSLLKRYTENISLSLDSDFAGDAAAHRGIQIADEAGLNIRVVTFEGAKDPDDLIKLDPSLWRKAVESSVSFYDFVIDSAIKKHTPNQTPILAEQAKAIVSEVTPFLGTIDNLVVKNHYLKKLSVELDVPVDDLETQIAKDFRKNQLGTLAPKTEKTPKATKIRNEIMEEYLLSLLLQSENPSDYLVLISQRLSSDEFFIEILGKIYALLISFCEISKDDTQKTSKGFSIKNFVASLPAELVDTTDRLFLTELPSEVEDETTRLSEISKTTWEIKELSLREKLRLVGHEIKDDPESETLAVDFATKMSLLQKLLEEKQLLKGIS